MANTSSRSGTPRNKSWSTHENEPAFIEDVRSRAYALYESRGREDGDDLKDWLLAEQQALGVRVNIFDECSGQRENGFPSAPKQR